MFQDTIINYFMFFFWDIRAEFMKQMHRLTDVFIFFCKVPKNWNIACQDEDLSGNKIFFFHFPYERVFVTTKNIRFLHWAISKYISQQINWIIIINIFSWSKSSSFIDQMRLTVSFSGPRSRCIVEILEPTSQEKLGSSQYNHYHSQAKHLCNYLQQKVIHALL